MKENKNDANKSQKLLGISKVSRTLIPGLPVEDAKPKSNARAGLPVT